MVDVELVVLGGGLALSAAMLLVPLGRPFDRPSAVATPPRPAVSSIGQLASLLGGGTAAFGFVGSARG